MKKLLTLLLLFILPSLLFAQYPDGSPVARYGKLQVKGTFLCNEAGDPVQLRGVSSHGLQWFGEFMHEKSIAMFANEWKADIIRASMYTAPEANGYIKNKDLKNKVIEVVNLSEKYGLYCIIDWHQLSDNDPNIYKDESKAFFKEMVTLFKDKKHVLYEICNEPDDEVEWIADIKPYAKELIPVIQGVDDKAIVIVGTPYWCQNVDEAAASPLEGKNIMYTLHFYAGEHGDWVINKFKKAVTEIPIFVTEFGTTMADGDRGVFLNETSRWLRLLHEHKVSWVNWSLSDKNEDCALLKPGTPYDGDWSDSDLTRSGLFIKNRLINGYSAGPYTITVPEIEHGRIEITPKQDSYEFGEQVLIEVIPDAGYKAHSWQGITDKENPAFVTVYGDFDCWPILLPKGEQIVNGSFDEGFQPWKFVSWGESSAGAIVKDGKFTAEIEKAGTDQWEIQLQQKDVSLERGKIYRLAFTASATEERKIDANIGMSQAPWDTYSDFGSFTIGTAPKRFVKTFKMEKGNDNNARVFFDLGKYSTADVTISEVSLIDTSHIIPILHNAEKKTEGNRVHVTGERVELHLNEQFSKEATLKIFSVQGKELFRSHVSGTKVTLNREQLGLASGIYYLKVQNNSVVQYQPLTL